MSSIRDQIVAAAVAALNVGSPPCIFERSRLVALGDADLPSGVVYPTRDDTDDAFLDHSPVTRSKLRLAIELRALGTSSVRPDAAADALYVWLVSKLANNKLGGLCLSMVELSSHFQYALGASPICLLTVEMVATYQHLTANAEATK